MLPHCFGSQFLSERYTALGVRMQLRLSVAKETLRRLGTAVDHVQGSW
jgi:hypothetical protein